MPSSPVPQHCPTPRELDDLELLVSGALAPLTGFDEPGSPVTLVLPAELGDAGEIELVDPEGLPLARVTRESDGSWAVTPLARVEFGPFRRLHLSPSQVRERYAGRTFVPITGPVTEPQLDRLTGLGPTVLLALVGTGTPDLSAVALLRATLRVAGGLPDAEVVAVSLAAHGDPAVDHALGVQVVDTYAGPDPVVGLVDDGEPLLDLEDIIDADQPATDRRGLVLFFTGLSGSGKSTLARALMDRLLEQGHRTLTSLDGDVVRRNLSAGLSFSKQDRETNIRRIGWVAAEISRHGGVAVCSPIAPFDQTRQQVREMVADAGGAFFLVHVATPLEECERRDRKGLYAKARRGEIPEFTGISSPYEEPNDADVRVDTTGRSIEEALDDVVDALAEAGYVDLSPVPEGVEARTLPPRPPVVEEAVRERLETDPLKVLFVCTANICRSPTMELLARRMVTDGSVTFSSSGTHGFRDSGVDPVMAAAVESLGIETGGFRSRPLTREQVAEADLVVTAEAAHRTYVLDEDPAAFRKVFTLGQLADTVERLGFGLGQADLLVMLGQRRSTADPRLDVPDPNRQGRAAVAACVKQIESLLGVVVPALVRTERITT